LYGRDPQQPGGFFVGQLWRQGVADNLAAILLCRPPGCIAIKLIYDLL
jgi:hypothetical protein